MANKREGKNKAASGRAAGGFIALPWVVVDSPAYLGLSMHARALLLEVARQYVRDNNGRLLMSRAYLLKRGWKSVDMIQKAKTELQTAGFVHQTVQGHRPNKASWYAVTWQRLDRHPDFDFGAERSFVHCAFMHCAFMNNTPLKYDVLRPSGGTGKARIAPPHGTADQSAGPPHGPITARFMTRAVPPHGHHLDKPSVAAGFGAVC